MAASFPLLWFAPPFFSLTAPPSDIFQDGNQVLFKSCPGTKDVPCERPVHMGQSDDPRCPLHLPLPPPMYRPEREPPQQEHPTPGARELYLSAAELRPTESLPLEFSDVCGRRGGPGGGGSLRSPAFNGFFGLFPQDLDVEGDGTQGPPSPLQFDTALALEDHTIRAIAEAPMDLLTADDPDQADPDVDDDVAGERVRSGRSPPPGTEPLSLSVTVPCRSCRRRRGPKTTLPDEGKPALAFPLYADGNPTRRIWKRPPTALRRVPSARVQRRPNLGPVWSTKC